MGTDKALIPFLGKPLVQRILERLIPVVDEALVTTNHPERYSFLNVPLVGDVFPGRGALGGLYTALRSAHYTFVAVVACDMPFANPELLEILFRTLEESHADAVIPQTANGNEPFHAVYRRENCLPLVRQALEDGHWRADAWFWEANLRFLSPEEVSIFDPLGLAFQNVNTPDELAAAEELARQLEQG
ncbi:MAG: Molybdopterin-guanine dinucleotide biosynthesis protein MobA [Anaerolineae bacterium]|nr:MAG: Molybdopterin-guanine dinucleotide biosynthesis protein MobA [Anaerolineae bacterium]